MRPFSLFLGSLRSRRSAGLLLAGALAVMPLTRATAQPAAAQPSPPAAGEPAAQPAAAQPATAEQPSPQGEPAVGQPAPAAAEQPSPPAAGQPTAVPEPVKPIAEHAEAAAEAAAKAGEPEAAEHEHGPLIENWWSWDYGPGKPHHHPPFGFALINFAVFLFLLYRLAGKDFREFLISRHTEVRKSLDRARQVETKAQEQLRHFEERTQSVDTEIKTLLTNLRTAAEAERQNIIARAEADAQKLLRDAESQVQVALDAARRELEQKAALLAVELAEKLITARITDADQQRLVDRYVAQVEGLAAKTDPALEGRP